MSEVRPAGNKGQGNQRAYMRVGQRMPIHGEHVIGGRTRGASTIGALRKANRMKPFRFSHCTAWFLP